MEISREWQARLEDIKAVAKLRPSKKEPENGQTSTQITSYKLEECGIYKRFSKTTFESIARRGINNPHTLKNYDKCLEYAKDFKENAEKGIGVLMLGQYGTLKTSLAVAILRDVIEQGYKGLLVPMPSLMDNLYTMGRLNPGEAAVYERRIRTVKLLVIDDLGGENIGVDWVQAKINSIITDRHAKMLPTIITTNLSPDELKATYEGRIIDRLRSSNLQLAFQGTSERQPYKAED